jgi:hypothetical protein
MFFYIFGSRIKETAESIAEEVKYLLETDIKIISVSEIL